jgi:hypothetical protein
MVTTRLNSSKSEVITPVGLWIIGLLLSQGALLLEKFLKHRGAFVC